MSVFTVSVGLAATCVRVPKPNTPVDFCGRLVRAAPLDEGVSASLGTPISSCRGVGGVGFVSFTSSRRCLLRENIEDVEVGILEPFEEADVIDDLLDNAASPLAVSSSFSLVLTGFAREAIVAALFVCLAPVT